MAEEVDLSVVCQPSSDALSPFIQERPIQFGYWMADIANERYSSASQRVHRDIRFAIARSLQIDIRAWQRSGAQRSHIHHYSTSVVAMQQLHQRTFSGLSVPIKMAHLDSNAVFFRP